MRQQIEEEKQKRRQALRAVNRQQTLDVEAGDWRGNSRGTLDSWTEISVGDDLQCKTLCGNSD